MNRPDVPTDQPFVSSMEEAAVGVHEMYATFLRAGFNEKQALKLVMQYLRLSHECPNHTPES